MKLVKILPDKIQIKTDDAEFKNVRLNDLISVSDSEVKLVTQVCAITDNDVEAQLDNNTIIAELKQPSLKMIECSILGSIVNGKFKGQIDKYPTTDVYMERIEDCEFSAMLCHDVQTSFYIGTYSGYGSVAPVNAWVDGNRFYQRHACIVGNTGCGKSETVTKIMEETVGNTNCNIVVFDIHGEYSRLSYVDNIEIGKNFSFPIWMLGFQSMCANILKLKEESASIVMSALRKAYYGQCPDGNEGKPCYFCFESILDYLRALNAEMLETGEFYKTGDKAGMAKTVKGDYNGKLSGIINTMDTLLSDKRYSFLFESKSAGITLGADYLYEFINRIMGGEKNIKNIDLSGVPHDIAIVIIGVVTNLIYNVQLQQKAEEIKPITLICDEAHIYIPMDFQLSASQRRIVDIFENIAKEGRKFGITLFVASQRPSELNKTIMAQCANYIVMKLNNENDKTMIKGMMPEGSSNVIEQTTMFSPGDCLVIGDAVPIPLKIHVEFATERPQSKTINFWSEWKKEKGNVNYGDYLKEYISE